MSGRKRRAIFNSVSWRATRELRTNDPSSRYGSGRSPETFRPDYVQAFLRFPPSSATARGATNSGKTRRRIEVIYTYNYSINTEIIIIIKGNKCRGCRALERDGDFTSESNVIGKTIVTDVYYNRRIR